MENNIIPNEDGKGFTTAYKGKDVEFVNPIEYLKQLCFNSVSTPYRKVLELEKPDKSSEQIAKETLAMVNEVWEERYKKIVETEVPANLLAVLTAEKKHYQEQFIKKIKLTPEILMAFIFKAYKEFGYTFSQYTSHQYPPNIEATALPKFAELNKETGEIRKIGSTTLTDGQIKHAITNRKVVVAKFIDKGSEWHAFYITFRSIGGEETWQNHQPHYHYASNKFGVSREEVLKRFKNGGYQDTGVHIPLLGYGNQPENP